MWLTIIALILGILALLVAIGGALYVWIYWRLIQRPLPDWEGEFNLACLEAPVEVLRDKHGIPHIYAQSRADLYRAQGYVHAQDRLWQMEQNRRIAAGTLAEVFGPPALEADRFSRIVGFRRAAQAELDALDAESRQVLAWYAEGVNAYIAERPRRLAAEFNLLRVQPQPWTPLDGWVAPKSWLVALRQLGKAK
ncbi:MAG: penicillin acylase family protein [Caldilineaceae bacterium]